MALKKRGRYWYGDSQADIRPELVRYSKTSYLAEHFADAVCACGGGTFRLTVDEDAGVAVRTCSKCGDAHPIGDSAEYLDGATLEECECPGGAGDFEITAGVSLYDDSDDVRWLYLGCRCPDCGLTSCYADWKNEFEGYEELLKNV